MDEIEIRSHEVEAAISIRKEVAAWGREQGYRVWPDEWLTPKELIISHAQPENSVSELWKERLPVTEAIRKECRKRGSRYIRLDTGLDEKEVRRIYLNAGYKIVDIIDYPNGRSMALYELEVNGVKVF